MAAAACNKRESSAAVAMETSGAAKAVKTPTARKAMDSRSDGQESRGGRNGAGDKAMETRAGAAKVMKYRNAAVLAARVHGRAAGAYAPRGRCNHGSARHDAKHQLHASWVVGPAVPNIRAAQPKPLSHSSPHKYQPGPCQSSSY
jgi:hypothetical protein